MALARCPSVLLLPPILDAYVLRHLSDGLLQRLDAVAYRLRLEELLFRFFCHDNSSN